MEARLASQFRYTHRHESTQLGNILTCFSTVYGIGTGDKRNSVDEKTCSLTKNPFNFNRRGVMFEYVIFLHFDFGGINFFKFETLLLRTKSIDR